MPIKIYWGPPGSYKSASAVWDDVTACAKQGRVLITNIRGMTEERCRKHLKEIGEGFKVIHLRNSVPEEMEQIRRWWHWAPFGAFIILDEVQAVYPPDWTAAKMHELDLREPRLAPNGEPLASTVSLMFDMHRHGNWDLTFTTPSIKKVRSEIRAAAEVAYKHKNLAIIGWRGRFMRFMHSAEDNGNPGDIYSSTQRKVPKYVFELYDSTATGAVQDSKAGINIFASPRILFLLGILVLCGYFIFRNPVPAALSGKAQSERQANAAQVGGAGNHAPAAQGVRPSSEVHPALLGGFITGTLQADDIAAALISTPEGQTKIIPLSLCERKFMGAWSCNDNGVIYHDGRYMTELQRRPIEQSPAVEAVTPNV